MLRCAAIRVYEAREAPGLGPLTWRVECDNLKSEAMPSLISDYMPLVVFVILAALICGALLIVPFLVAYRAPDSEKLSPVRVRFSSV